jgi:hypothetical protein
MQCKEWDDANSKLFKESHDEAVHKISYESKLYELISASLARSPSPCKQGEASLRSVISACSVVHPLATSWPSPPKGGARGGVRGPLPLKGAQGAGYVALSP